jgi:tRNA(fMet)-specific endonuclease VapC
MYALDTNTLIYFCKGLGQVAARLLATPPSEIVIPSIVVFELEVGIQKSTSPATRRQQLDELKIVVAVAPFDEAAARAAARVRADLESVGMPIGPFDTLIAGTALARGATLVTHNADEFGRVEGLRVEDWF